MNKPLVKLLLFKWKSLIPYASIQRTFIENIKVNSGTPAPFDMRCFDPLLEINVLQDKIIEHCPKLLWIKTECDLPQNLCDDDWAELYARYNYMVIEKIKKNVYGR